MRTALQTIETLNTISEVMDSIDETDSREDLLLKAANSITTDEAQAAALVRPLLQLRPGDEQDEGMRSIIENRIEKLAALERKLAAQNQQQQQQFHDTL